MKSSILFKPSSHGRDSRASLRNCINIFGRYIFCLVISNLVCGLLLAVLSGFVAPEMSTLSPPIASFALGVISTIWAVVGVVEDPWLGIPLLIFVVVLGLSALISSNIVLRWMRGVGAAAATFAGVVALTGLGAHISSDTASWGNLRDPLMLLTFLPFLLTPLVARILKKIVWAKPRSPLKKSHTRN